MDGTYWIWENKNLAPYCSMKVGGRARFLAEPTNEAEFCETIAKFRKLEIKYIVVGKCSNLLFTDDGYDGAVILTSGMKGISVSGLTVTAMCGEPLSMLSKTACDNSIAGFETLHGIPGAVGGGVYMNAGAYEHDISERFVRGRFLDSNGKIVEFTRDEMDFSYRKSRMQSEELYLISATFEGIAGNKDEIRERIDTLMAGRRAKQPLEYPSCGSTFKRPVGHYAGALIEQCGLKGKTVGGAQVSEKHAGFIINIGGATASDVLELIELVRQEVLEKTGVELEPEVRIIR